MLAATIEKNDRGDVIAYHNPTTGYKWRIITFDHPSRTEPGKIEFRSMKVIEHPGVYVVGSMQLHETEIDAYLADHQIKTFSPWGGEEDRAPGKFARNARGEDQELLVELSGRICYMSYERPRPGGVGAFIDRLKSEGHGSVLEHPHYSFIVTGVSRNMTLEANRHRPFSISQLSGRFVDASEVGFVIDADYIGDDALTLAWARTCLTAYDEYEAAYERNYQRQLRKWSDKLGANLPNTATPDKATERKLIKKARERARDILPGCLETRVLYTVNARAVRFIFEKRLHADAAFEIRRCFGLLFDKLAARDPLIFSDYTKEPLEDGTFTVSTAFGKI